MFELGFWGCDCTSALVFDLFLVDACVVETLFYLVLLALLLLARAMLAQFRFPSPFARAYLASPPLLQEALDRLHIGPFHPEGT